MPEPQYVSTDPNWGQAAPASPTQGTGFAWFKSPSAEARERGFARNPDLDRPDNSLLGVPPELAVTSGLGIARAAGAHGLSAIQRAYAGAQATGEILTPVVKYEIAHQVLRGMGTPEAIALPLALAVSGLRRGTKPASSPASAPAAPASPAAASPAAPAPAAAPSAPAAAPASPVGSGPSPGPAGPPPRYGQHPLAEPPYGGGRATAPPQGDTVRLPAAQRTPGQMSPQWIQNDLGLAARRSKVTLTEPQYQAAEKLVREGMSPADAVADVARRVTSAAPVSAASPATPPSPKAPTKKGPTRARLTADEADEYLRLLDRGMSHDEAVAALMQQRTLAKKLGTPTPDSVRHRVAERNVTGRWPEEQ